MSGKAGFIQGCMHAVVECQAASREALARARSGPGEPERAGTTPMGDPR